MSRAAIVLAVLLAGCSPSPSSSPSQSVAPSPSPSAFAEPGSTGTSRPSPVVDERLFGAIVAIDGAPSITLDLGRLFGTNSIEEAIAAARADGIIGPDEDLPNSFYVRDLHERRTIGVDPAATVVVLGHDADGNSLPTPITLLEFAALWRTGPSSGAWQPAGYYWCSLSDGTVVGIEAVLGP